jgi:hypothetical protein
MATPLATSFGDVCGKSVVRMTSRPCPAQDPARDRMELIADASDQGVERRFVAVHRLLDELPLHPSPPADPVGGPVRGV